MILYESQRLCQGAGFGFEQNFSRLVSAHEHDLKLNENTIYFFVEHDTNSMLAELSEGSILMK